MSSLLELLKAKKQALAAGNRAKTYKLGDGTGRYRILPSWRKDGSEQFWHDFGQHFVKNAAGETQAVYVCADKTYGRPCNVCDAIRAGIKASTDDATVELLKEATSSGRILVNAVHLDGKDPTAVVLLELPGTVFGQIVDIVTEWTEAEHTPLDPVEGKDLLVTRTGTGKNTKYTTQVAAKSTKLSPDVMNKLHDLDAYVAQENQEQEQRALNSVRTAAGLLAAPGAAAGVKARLAPAPAPSAATTLVEPDDYAVAAPPVKKAKPVEEFEDVEVDKPKATPAATKAEPAATPAVAESSGDAELDALLAELG